MPAARGRADSGDLEIDLTELFVDAASVATDLGVGVALYVDEMQDIPADDVSALCAACHELSQSGGPLIVVGAGLPHLPAVLSASKSYSERLFRYARIDRLDRGAADLALLAPAEREGVTFTSDALDALYEAADGYPLLRPGVRQGRLGRRARRRRSATATSWSRLPRRKGSSPSDSSAAGTNAPPPPSATTCGRWPRWATSRYRPRTSPTSWAVSPPASHRPATA